MKQCELCKKSSVVVGSRKKLRGKYNPVNRSRKYPNLQWTKANGKRVYVCARCLKSLHR